MWHVWAIALAGVTIFGLFLISLVFARRDTADELRVLFDTRAVRRALLSWRRFGIRTLMWLTAGTAAVIVGVQALGNTTGTYLLIASLILACLLLRIVLLTLTEPGVRRMQPPRKFPADNHAKCGKDAKTKGSRLAKASVFRQPRS